MAFRFIIVDDDNYRFVGTDDEVRAREWAEDVLVYDTQTGKSLNFDACGRDADVPPAEPRDDEDEDHG